MVFKANLDKKDIVQIIRDYQKKLQDNGINVKQIILFGSYAKGHPHPWSDLDLCVISDDFGKDSIEETSKVNYLANDISPLIEAHPLTSEDLEEENVSYAQEIKKSGIEY